MRQFTLLCSFLIGVVVLGSLENSLEGQPAAKRRIAPVFDPSQFGPPAKPYSFDDVQGEFINFETPLIQPLIAAGPWLFAINEPDNRVVVLDAEGLDLVAEVPVGLGPAALCARPGWEEDGLAGPEEVWVSCMHSSAVMVIDTGTFRVTHVLRPRIEDSGLGAGHAATPGGIAFSSPDRAFVAATSTDAVVIYDAEQKTVERVVPLAVMHNGLETRVKEPRVVVFDPVEDRIYVASWKSGNQTLAPVARQHVGRILNLEDDPNLSLPDYDVVALDSATGAVVQAKSRRGVGTLNFGMAARSAGGALVIAHMDAENGVFLGEGSFPDGNVCRNMLSILGPGQFAPPYEYSVDLASTGDTLAMPTSVTVDGTDRIYVAAYGSRAVGVFGGGEGPESTLVYHGSLRAEEGPRGLAVAKQSSGEEVLYCLNRISGSVTGYPITGSLGDGEPDRRYEFVHDPTYDQVARGRSIYNDSRHSGASETGCFSCHPDLQEDGLAWDLSATYDEGTFESPPRFVKDRKLAMVTQDCRSLEDNPPYHWRGEQEDLEDFNGAFERLLHGESLSDPDFASLKAYVFSGVYPANPHQRMNRGLGPMAIRGVGVFTGETREEGSCSACHSFPIGTQAAINGRFVELGTSSERVRTIKIPQLRGLWIKESAPTKIGSEGGEDRMAAYTGFGITHAGNFFNVENFVRNRFGSITSIQQTEVLAFLKEFDSGVAPAANYSEMFDERGVFQSRLSPYLTQQADAGYCDIALKGTVDVGQGPLEIGMVYDRNRGLFVTDRDRLDPVVGPFTYGELRDLAAGGNARLLVLGVPYWSGERIGVDRDRDGFYDGDELVAGLDPTVFDTDGDGLWDSYDPAPESGPNGDPDPVGAPFVVPGSMRVVFANTNAAKIVYETNTFSVSRVLFGDSTDYGRVAGDPLVLETGSNHWKRRHSVLLRLLDPEKTYHFRVETVGQNGEVGGSTDFTLDTATLFNAKLLQLVQFTVTAQGSGEATTFQVRARVLDALGRAMSDVGVHAMATHLIDGGDGDVPVLQEPVDSPGVTDVNGELAFVFTPPGTWNLQSQDKVDFFVPMYRDDSADGEPPLTTVVPGLTHEVVGSEFDFSWSGSRSTEATVKIP